MESIRKVCESDKKYVLEYCKDTFSWGDYISYVWDDWITDGDFLAYDDCISSDTSTTCMRPVGICHVHSSDKQIWVEGIRVHPLYRRRGIATKLVMAAEEKLILLHNTPHTDKSATFYDKCTMASRMLIDAKNDSSLFMADNLGYNIIGTWSYYKLQPKQYSSDQIHVMFTIIDTVDSNVYEYYVDSWRWFQTRTLYDTLSKSMIVSIPESSDVDTCLDGQKLPPLTAIIVISKSVEGNGLCMYVTLYSTSSSNYTKTLIKYLRNVAFEHNCEHICVFAQQHDVLPLCDGLEKSFTFHLVEKMFATLS